MSLAATEFLDHEAPAMHAFLARALGDLDRPPRALAVDLHYAIRDGVAYEIYGADLSRTGLRASTIAESGRGLCLHKSTLFAACARALGIPSRLALVDVRNHVVSPRLRRFLGDDVVHYHCYAQVELDGRWVSATPVFSRTLCRLYRMEPLAFGRVLQENDGSRMEVVHRHGLFDDLPYELVERGLRAAHPNLFAAPSRVRAGSLMTEAAA
jgi:hypothetical protein